MYIVVRATIIINMSSCVLYHYALVYLKYSFSMNRIHWEGVKLLLDIYSGKKRNPIELIE